MTDVEIKDMKYTVEVGYYVWNSEAYQVEANSLDEAAEMALKEAGEELDIDCEHGVDSVEDEDGNRYRNLNDPCLVCGQAMPDAGWKREV